MKYYVEVFKDEDNTKLLKKKKKQEISVPEEYYRFKNIWEALYVIDTERMAIKRVTDSYERKSLIHTGIRLLWVDEFIEEYTGADAEIPVDVEFHAYYLDTDAAKPAGPPPTTTTSAI